MQKVVNTQKRVEEVEKVLVGGPERRARGRAKFVRAEWAQGAYRFESCNHGRQAGEKIGAFAVDIGPVDGAYVGNVRRSDSVANGRPASARFGATVCASGE